MCREGYDGLAGQVGLREPGLDRGRQLRIPDRKAQVDERAAGHVGFELAKLGWRPPSGCGRRARPARESYPTPTPRPPGAEAPFTTRPARARSQAAGGPRLDQQHYGGNDNDNDDSDDTDDTAYRAHGRGVERELRHLLHVQDAVDRKSVV